MQAPKSLRDADREGDFIEIDPIRLLSRLSGSGNHRPLGNEKGGLSLPPLDARDDRSVAIQANRKGFRS
jgi:hypothetical protein